MICSKCGQLINGTLQFCQFCGSRVAEPKVSQPAGTQIDSDKNAQQSTLPTMDALQQRIAYTKVKSNPEVVTHLQQEGAEVPPSSELTSLLKAKQEREGADRQKKTACLVIGWLSFAISLLIEPIILPIIGISMGVGCYKYDKKQGLLLIAVNGVWLCYTLFAPLLRMFRRDSIGTLV